MQKTISPEQAQAFDIGLRTLADSPAYHSSPVWEAWAVGRFLQERGVSNAEAYRARGSTLAVNVGGMICEYRVSYFGKGRSRVERILGGAK